MEPLLIYTGIVFLFFSLVQISFISGFVVGLWVYGRSYWDGAEKTGDRRWVWFASWRVWQFLRRVFALHVVFSDDSSSSSSSSGGGRGPENPVEFPPTLYVCYPHGVLALYVLGTFLVHPLLINKKKDVRVAGHWLLTTIPLLRELALWAGVVNADWATIRGQLFNKGRDVAIIPDGVRGMGTPIKDTQEISKRFLQRVWDEGANKINVQIVLCPNELKICKCWSEKSEWRLVRWLRQTCVSIFGYPFPTLFIGPWPREDAPLLVRILPPIRAEEGESFAQFKLRFENLLSS